jgi:putative ABC transport system permease protein
MLARLRSLWRNLARRSRVESELDEELGAFLSLSAEARRGRGITPAAERRAGRREAREIERVKEEVRAVRAGHRLETLVQDVRFGLRTLARTPVLSAAAVLALALGIGANTAVFSVVNAVLLRPLAFPEPHQLLFVAEATPTGGPDDVAPPNFLDWRGAQTVFADLAAYTPVSLNLTGVPSPETIDGYRATASLFSVLGVDPWLGRRPDAAGDVAGGGREIVLSHELWRSRFQGDSAVLGRALTLDDEPYTVVAVMPAGFAFPVESPGRFWVPMAFTEGDVTSRGAHYLNAVGRLRPGVTVGAAQAAMDVIAQRLADAYPASNADAGVALAPLKHVVVGASRTTFLLLWGAVAFVLLIATANVASMLLARAAARGREMATRVALGAGARRLVAQLLTESLLLAAFGGALGVLVAAGGVRILHALNPGNVARFGQATIDPLVLGFTALVALGAGVLFGLAPALAVTRRDVTAGLREGGRGTVGGATQWYRGVLVVNEVALAVVVLVGAGLMLTSLRNLLDTDPGFDTDRVLSLRINLSRTAYPDHASRVTFFDRLEERVTALPGVEAAGAITFLPMTFPGGTLGIAIEGAPPPQDGQWEGAVFRVVTPDYFAAMGIRMREGRAFRRSDDASAPGVAIVTRALAERHWPDRSAVGQHLKLGGPTSTAPWLTVVGVAEDVRAFALRRPPETGMFVPVAQPHPAWTAPRGVVVRAAGDPAALAASVRAAVWSIDRDLPISHLRPMREVVGATLDETRFYAVLLGLLGVIALALAAVGIYGVMAYSVSQRTREFGLRLALGAQPGAIVGMVLRRGLALAAVGLGVGVAGAVGVTRFLGSQLYGLSPTDPGTLARGVLLLLGTALAACALPAWRAARVNPMDSLREE